MKISAAEVNERILNICSYGKWLVLIMVHTLLLCFNKSDEIWWCNCRWKQWHHVAAALHWCLHIDWLSFYSNTEANQKFPSTFQNISRGLLGAKTTNNPYHHWAFHFLHSVQLYKGHRNVCQKAYLAKWQNKKLDNFGKI